MIKSRAKRALKNNYWLLVGIFFVYSLISSATFFVRLGVGDVDLTNFSSFMETYSKGEGTNAALSLGINAANLLISIFVGNVLAVGAARIALKAYRGESFEFTELFYGFNSNRYLPFVGAMALCDLAVAAGVIFCVIPGIIIGLGLAMVPYILVENSNEYGVFVTASESLSKSWNMMKGHKGDYFIFQLSFIGWFLLEVITAGIAGVLFVTPYFSISCAGWYEHHRVAQTAGEYQFE